MSSATLAARYSGKMLAPEHARCTTVLRHEAVLVRLSPWVSAIAGRGVGRGLVVPSHRNVDVSRSKWLGSSEALQTG